MKMFEIFLKACVLFIVLPVALIVALIVAGGQFVLELHKWNQSAQHQRAKQEKLRLKEQAAIEKEQKATEKAKNNAESIKHQIAVAQDELNSWYVQLEAYVKVQEHHEEDLTDDMTDSELKQFAQLDKQIMVCNKNIGRLEIKIEKLEKELATNG